MSSQEFFIAATVYHEARGESIDGQVAVAHVIMNRALFRGLTCQEVVYQSKQFSCYNVTKTPLIRDYQAFIIAQKAVEMAREERLRGLSFYGSEYFMNEKVVLQKYGHLPGWLDNMTTVAIIGRHTFYKA